MSLISFNTSWGIIQFQKNIPKESKCIGTFLWINNETQCVPLLFLSSKFMKYASTFILGKLLLETTLLNLGSYLK